MLGLFSFQLLDTTISEEIKEIQLKYLETKKY